MAQKSVPILQCPDGFAQEFRHVGRSEMLHWAGRKKYIYIDDVSSELNLHIDR